MKETVNSSQATYDYTKTYPDIDYSEKKTEPGLVLSMREIYDRYAAQGVDLLAGELVKDKDDDRDIDILDFEPDDNLDVLQQSRLLRQRSVDRLRSASKQNKREQRERAEPEPEPDKKDEKRSDEE